MLRHRAPNATHTAVSRERAARSKRHDEAYEPKTVGTQTRYTIKSFKLMGNMCKIVQDEKTTICHIAKTHAEMKTIDFHVVLQLFVNKWHRYKRHVSKYQWFLCSCGQALGSMSANYQYL